MWFHTFHIQRFLGEEQNKRQIVKVMVNGLDSVAVHGLDQALKDKLCRVTYQRPRNMLTD
jgi:hypothetical protein